MNLIGKVNFYGKVILGEDLMIEDWVTIGHPSPNELNILDRSLFKNINDYYNAGAMQPTRIGNNAVIRSGTVIYSGVKLGDEFNCGHNVLIRENTTIGNNTYIKPFSDIQKNVSIGNNCRIGGLIADNVVIGDNVSTFGIITHKNVETNLAPAPAATIESDCIIGRGAIILGGVTIGKGTTIGANTLVNFDVPENSFVVGSKGTIKTSYSSR